VTDNIALVASQIKATQLIEAALQSDDENCRKKSELLKTLKSEVSDLIKSQPGSKLRDALIVDGIYRLKVVSHLIQHQVTSEKRNWLWQSYNRAYFNSDTKTVVVKQGQCQADFNYDFIDDVSRLVITPLTIEAYHNHMRAISTGKIMNSTGPAGCGKTETLRDLAKNLGYTSIVFNCSDQMGSKFWDRPDMWNDLKDERCFLIFDEFNRIPEEPNNEIETAVKTLSQAISKPGLKIGTTFNPGYAGRTKVPLRELFVTLPLQVPDMQDIAEGLLAKVGFTNYVNLAEYICRIRENCRNYLQANDIYDFGMRPLNSICKSAGKFLAQQSDNPKCEMKAVQDGLKLVWGSKFAAEDHKTFSSFIDQFFADVEGSDYPESRVEQMKLMMDVRHAVVAFGDEPKGLELMKEVGKSTGHEIHETRYAGDLAKFYGKLGANGEWSDGLFTKVFRQASHQNEKAIICITGVQDLKDIVAIMAENLNQVMDDNKRLVLASNEVIKMPESVRICFCTNEARTWSPANVSRVGVVRVD